MKGKVAKGKNLLVLIQKFPSFNQVEGLLLISFDMIAEPPVILPKDGGKTRGSRKPKERRNQLLKAAQKKSRQSDDLEESLDVVSSDRSRGGVDWSATMDMR